MRDWGSVELDAVAAVARTRSFHGAATELGMSRTALSNAVAGLEKRLGTRLFHRTTRSVSLTEAGENFVVAVRPALATIRDAMEGLHAQGATPVGRLRINSSLGAAQRILAPIVLEYLRRYPEMKLEIVNEDRLIDIVAGGFDAAIRTAAGVPRDMVSVPLGMPIRYAIVGSPALFGKKALPKKPADLLLFPCICVREPGGGTYRWELQRRGKKFRVDVQGALTLGAPTLMHDAALGGAGLAYLPEWSVTADVDAGRLVRVLPDWMPPSEGALCLYYPGHRHVPAGLRAFVQVVREVTRAAGV